MDMVDTTALTSEVAKQGALFAFMLLVIIAQFFISKMLYNRNIMLSDNLQKIAIDSTLAINNVTLGVNANTRAIEVMNNAR